MPIDAAAGIPGWSSAALISSRFHFRQFIFALAITGSRIAAMRALAQEWDAYHSEMD